MSYKGAFSATKDLVLGQWMAKLANSGLDFSDHELNQAQWKRLLRVLKKTFASD